jgi:hypothetical protein
VTRVTLVTFAAIVGGLCAVALASSAACSLEGFSAKFGLDAAPVVVVDSGGAPSDGCNADLAHDGKNCGFCGHDCGDLACTDGACAPARFVTGEDTILGIAANDSAVVWSNEGHVRTCPATGCTTPAEVVDPRPLSGALVLTGDNLVFGTGRTSTNGAGRCTFPRCKDQQDTLYNVDGENSIAAEGFEVFFLAASQNRVLYCGTQQGCGDTPDLIANAPATGPAALGPLRLYWTARPPVNAIYACLRSGADKGSPLVPIASNQANPTAITTDAQRVYWTTFDDGAVRSCPLDGCGGAPTDLAIGQQGPAGIASDGSYVYWANAGGTVVRCPAAGCGGVAPTVLARGLTSPRALAMNATSLWIVAEGGSTILRVPK